MIRHVIRRFSYSLQSLHEFDAMPYDKTFPVFVDIAAAKQYLLNHPPLFLDVFGKNHHMKQ